MRWHLCLHHHHFVSGRCGVIAQTRLEAHPVPRPVFSQALLLARPGVWGKFFLWPGIYRCVNSASILSLFFRSSGVVSTYTRISQVLRAKMPLGGLKHVSGHMCDRIVGRGESHKEKPVGRLVLVVFNSGFQVNDGQALIEVRGRTKFKIENEQTLILL